MGEQLFSKDFTPQNPYLAWLVEHLDGWQFGEQGLITAILTALNEKWYAIEYGAGDGVSLPLTIDRIYDRGFNCLLVEIDETRRESLGTQYPKATIEKTVDLWPNGHVCQPSRNRYH